jgi:hypothetical protein
MDIWIHSVGSHTAPTQVFVFFSPGAQSPYLKILPRKTGIDTWCFERPKGQDRPKDDAENPVRRDQRTTAVPLLPMYVRVLYPMENRQSGAIL